MRALSLRQPWAWAIVADNPCPKRIENRIWRHLRHGFEKLKVPGVGDYVGIHASQTKPLVHDVGGVLESTGLDVLPPEAFTKSAIIGAAVVVDILRTDVKCTRVEGTEGKPFPHYYMREDDKARFLAACGPGGRDQQQEQIDRWWLGPYALVLDHVIRFKDPVPTKGALTFWEMLPELELGVATAMRTAWREAGVVDWETRQTTSVLHHLQDERDAANEILIAVDPAVPRDTFELRYGETVAGRTIGVDWAGAGKDTTVEVTVDSEGVIGVAPAMKTTQQLGLFGDDKPPGKRGIH